MDDDELAYRVERHEAQQPSDTQRLIVNIDARFDWMHPPKDTTQQILRDQANIKIDMLAKNFEKGIEALLTTAIAVMEQSK